MQLVKQFVIQLSVNNVFKMKGMHGINPFIKMNPPLSYEVLINKSHDFGLENAGTVVSMGNLNKGDVRKKESDLDRAI